MGVPVRARGHDRQARPGGAPDLPGLPASLRASELDGQGEAVGGTVVMRFGENALQVIERVKRKLQDLGPSFPPGIQVKVVYDRSDLIHRAIETLRHTLFEEMVVVSLVIFVFL